MALNLPTYDDATLALIAQRRDAHKGPCPRHPGVELLVWKEVYVGPKDDVHLTGMAAYADGCVVALRLDGEDPPVWKQ